MTHKVWFRKEKFQEVIDEQVRDYTALGGNALYGFIFLISLISGYIGKNALMFNAARLLLAAGALFTIIGFGMKCLVARTRPNKVSLKGASILEMMNDASFPSIHSGRAIILAFAVSPLIPGYGKIIFWLGMLGIPLTRIMLHKHYWSDVIAGAILGFVVAYWTQAFFIL